MQSLRQCLHPHRDYERKRAKLNPPLSFRGKNREADRRQGVQLTSHDMVTRLSTINLYKMICMRSGLRVERRARKNRRRNMCDERSCSSGASTHTHGFGSELPTV